MPLPDDYDDIKDEDQILILKYIVKYRPDEGGVSLEQMESYLNRGKREVYSIGSMVTLLVVLCEQRFYVTLLLVRGPIVICSTFLVDCLRHSDHSRFDAAIRQLEDGYQIVRNGSGSRIDIV